MSNTIFITANWTTGALSQQTISRQYDNNRYAVQFIGYPEGDGTEELDLYLLVWMSTAPGQKPGEITPIQLNSDQWYISNYFTQQVQVIKFQLCVLNEAGTYEAHSPIFSGRIGDSLEHDGTSHDIDVSTLFDAYREYVEELIIGAGAMIIDPTPTLGSANAVSSGGVYEEISTINDGLESISDEIDDVNSALSVLQDTVANIDGVPTAVRNAICVLCKKAVYTETGLLDELAVIESWASDITAITLNHTEAALNAETLQLIAVTVPEGGTITWQSNNTSVATVSSSGLVTPVSNGSVNIIAISGNAIATCSITVTGMKSLTGITATYTQSRTVYYTDSLAVLNSDLVVVATYDDSTSRTLLSNEYVLSGTLVEGTSTVTVTYGGYTATFSVAVTGNYTQYTKIIATGAQYIKTGLSETDLDGCSFEYKVNPTHSGASSGHLFSANNNFVAFPQVRGASALNHLIFAKLKGTERTSADNVWTEGTDITVVAYADSNNSVSMNGTTVIESVPAGSTTPSASNYYTMFAYGGSTGQTYRFKGALYYFKIYNSDGTLIHHYVPVVENSTGIAGVRDLITDTFHSSATSTAFTVE